jgi:monoamine oxidase
MSILAHKFMRLIETHADALAETLDVKIGNSERCATYSRVSSDELKTLVAGIYGQLGEWLVSKTEEDIERRYTMIGTRRAEQNVPVSQLLWCIVLVKENLWEYLANKENVENAQQVFGELELMQMVDQFFDRAMYYAVRGHERVREARIGEMRKSN